MAKERNINEIKDMIQVDVELISNIGNLIDLKAYKSLINIFADLHHADIAEIINHLRSEDATYAFKVLDNETAGEVLPELDENLRERILENIEPKHIAHIVEQLNSDDAADIIADLPDEIQELVFKNIDIESSADVKELLKYEEDTAGGIMDSDFVFIYDDANVADAIEEIRKNADEYDHIFYIYVLKRDLSIVGVVTIKSLLTNPLNSNITSVMEEDLIYIHPEMDQEEAATVMEKYDLVAIPVVDETKKMIGRITIDDALDVLNEEASEDLQKIAGLSEEQESSDSVFRISKIRLPWLVIALILEVFAAKVLHLWQDSLTAFASAIAFIPVVMAMGGSSGTQAGIVMVRGLSSGDIWLTESFKKIGKEVFVAILNGLACGFILFLATVFFFKESLAISLLVSGSLICVIMLATVLGATIPVLIKKIGSDPAIATGPFVTTLNDILGLIIYLSFITIFAQYL